MHLYSPVNSKVTMHCNFQAVSKCVFKVPTFQSAYIVHSWSSVADIAGKLFHTCDPATAKLLSRRGVCVAVTAP